MTLVVLWFFEQYTKGADIESIKARIEHLDGKYGKCWIARLEFLEDDRLNGMTRPEDRQICINVQDMKRLADDELVTLISILRTLEAIAAERKGDERDDD